MFAPFSATASRLLIVVHGMDVFVADIIDPYKDLAMLIAIFIYSKYVHTGLGYI